MKKCSKCGEEKDLSAFALNSKNKNLHDSWCYKCRCVAAKERRLANLDKYRARDKAQREKNGKRWIKANAERVKSSKDRYVQKYPERRIESQRKYRENNTESIKAKAKQYCSRPEVKVRLYENCMKRNAAKAKAVPGWANQKAIRAIYAKAAAMRLAGQDVEVDHIVPLNSKLVCGLHWEGNLQILPAFENRTKFNSVWPDMPDPNIKRRVEQRSSSNPS